MSAAPSTSFNPLKIALTATGVIAAATVGYAVYFDYRRRNDAVFRKNLLKEYKKVDKKVKHAQEAGKEQIQAALKRAIELANAEPVPTTAEGKEQFFMEQVALAEQLAARSPEFYVAAAISFYKALKVYPAPQELIMIYQKSLPPAVFDLVMELISLEINAAASSRSAGPAAGSRPAVQEDPILQELEEGELGENQAEKQGQEQEEEIQVTAPTTASSTQGSESSPTSSGSFVHVETDTNEGEAVKVEVGTNDENEATPAVVAEEDKKEDDEVEATSETPATQSDDPPEEPIAA
ncbi:TOM complex receptor protein TOM20 [Sporobolomyces koalae]|uniref:TOM complex receptor protein TOM20 n=1 Tax=Sporobolomyces koalae TaxID=500713 RepID=UPI0031803CA6